MTPPHTHTQEYRHQPVTEEVLLPATSVIKPQAISKEVFTSTPTVIHSSASRYWFWPLFLSHKRILSPRKKFHNTGGILQKSLSKRCVCIYSKPSILQGGLGPQIQA